MPKRILIVAGGAQYSKMLIEKGFLVSNVNTVEAARGLIYTHFDAILFTGGADVNPAMYGHTKHYTTQYYQPLDNLYEYVFKKAKETVPDMPMLGICRGAQFLCVMAGGILVQDVKGHALMKPHGVRTSWDETYFVTSTHHQMQYPVDVEHELMAYCVGIGKDAKMHINHKEVDVVLEVDYEVVYYPDTNSLGFQPHPEFGQGSCQDLWWECVKRKFPKLLEK